MIALHCPCAALVTMRRALHLPGLGGGSGDGRQAGRHGAAAGWGPKGGAGVVAARGSATAVLVLDSHLRTKNAFNPWQLVRSSAGCACCAMHGIPRARVTKAAGTPWGCNGSCWVLKRLAHGRDQTDHFTIIWRDPLRIKSLQGLRAVAMHTRATSAKGPRCCSIF